MNEKFNRFFMASSKEESKYKSRKPELGRKLPELHLVHSLRASRWDYLISGPTENSFSDIDNERAKKLYHHEGVENYDEKNCRRRIQRDASFSRRAELLVWLKPEKDLLMLQFCKIL